MSLIKIPCAPIGQLYHTRLLIWLQNISTFRNSVLKSRGRRSSSSARFGATRAEATPQEGSLTLTRRTSKALPMYFAPWTNYNCHWVCWIPVFCMLFDLGLIPKTGLTDHAGIYFETITEMCQTGFSDKLSPAIKVRKCNVHRKGQQKPADIEN